MSEAPLTYGDSYSVRVEAIASSDGRRYTSHTATTGLPMEDRSPSSSFRVIVGDAASLQISLGANGLTLHSVKLLDAVRVVVRAVVTAGPTAPDWLPTEASYMLFDGDRGQAAGVRDRYIPFQGMVEDRSWSADGTPLDQLAVAIGRSVARANASLARVRGEGGVALVSSVTVRIAIGQAGLTEGRLLVNLARPSEGQADQYVELTMTTVPAEEEG